MSERIDTAVVMAQFAEKISALRVAMTKVEQGMLDEMVANAAFDVDAHGIATFKVNQAVTDSKVQPAVINLASAAALEKTTDAAAVEAHALMPAQRVTFKFDPKVGYRVAGKVSDERIASKLDDGI